MKKQFCIRIEKEVNIEECYKCFIETGAFPRSDICRKYFITKELELPSDYESNKKEQSDGR